MADVMVVAIPSEAPYTTSSLTANLVCRVLLALLANLACIVPMRLLWQNAEFAAVVFLVNLEIKNLNTIVSALIWRNDDTASWWPGYGLCDVTPYITNISQTLFLTCLLAIIRNLAQQVGLLRAHPLMVREKRRRNLFQALIMFPLPVIQLAFMWPLTYQRFAVGTLVGCSWMGYPAWPYITFFLLVPTLVALLTTAYAILIYIRFREVAKATSSALSHNRVAHFRAQRTRRRLYLMVLSILLPFLPIVITLAVFNFKDAVRADKVNKSMDLPSVWKLDYDQIHNHVFPAPWNTITLIPSSEFNFAAMNICYISIFAAIPVFLFFGMTKDAMNTYRINLVRIGLGKIWPSLYTVYDPDRSAYANSTDASNSTSSSGSTIGKIKSAISASQLKITGTSSGNVSRGNNSETQTPDRTFSDTEKGHSVARHGNQPNHTPSSQEETDVPNLPLRNPSIFRTNLTLVNFPLIPNFLPLFKLKNPEASSGTLPITESSGTSSGPSWGDGSIPAVNNPESHSRVQTRVWSHDEEADIYTSSPSKTITQSLDSMTPAVRVETHLSRQSTRR